METDLVLALFTFTIAASVTPGPNNMMLLASGANFGLRRTLPHMVGISLGFQAMLILTGVGLMNIFERWPLSLTLLMVLSTGYLLWLAWRIAHAAPPAPGEAGGKPITLMQAAVFQWVNPKGWTMALSAITLYAPGRDTASILIVALAFLVAFVVAGPCWVTLGQRLRRLLSDPRKLRVFNWTMAVLLVATLVPVLLARF